MSLYISGLSLPKGEAYLIDPNGAVYRYISTEDGENHYLRKIDAKAIEVHHGRLVDADDLEERIKICKETAQNDDFDLGVVWYSAFAEMAAFSPTIIPADGADKEET